MSFSLGDSVPVVTDFPVRYAETDAMGVVHHANYLVYFEEGRSYYMRSMGCDYAEIEASGFNLPVTEAGLRYVGSLKYGDRVTVRTAITQNKSRRLTFVYEILSWRDSKTLVTGFTSHVWTNAAGEVTRAPSTWHTLVEQFTENEPKQS